MIQTYCYNCGLFITVNNTFAGGKGTCPRCKTKLRIPKPKSPGSANFSPLLRYVTTPASKPAMPAGSYPVVTENLGPSNRYHCAKCGNKFESLLSKTCAQSQCPACKSTGEIISEDVKFPRQNSAGKLIRYASCPIKASHILEPPATSDKPVKMQQIPASKPGIGTQQSQEETPQKDAPATEALSIEEEPHAVLQADSDQSESADFDAILEENLDISEDIADFFNENKEEFVTLYPDEDQSATENIIRAKHKIS